MGLASFIRCYDNVLLYAFAVLSSVACRSCYARFTESVSELIGWETNLVDQGYSFVAISALHH